MPASFVSRTALRTEAEPSIVKTRRPLSNRTEGMKRFTAAFPRSARGERHGRVAGGPRALLASRTLRG